MDIWNRFWTEEDGMGVVEVLLIVVDIYILDFILFVCISCISCINMRVIQVRK